jgi:SAM-dependent methyltransferase
MAKSIKRYDRGYFERWYRGRALSGASLRRQAELAVALSESMLSRRIVSVLDVGAGEGRWHPLLRRIRPRIRYLGVEPSEWAVARWGHRRNLVQGDLSNLGTLGLGGPFDLVLLNDVLHYLPAATVRRGLMTIAPLVDGLLFAPTFTRHDEIVGDKVEFQQRTAVSYRRAFHAAGLRQVGPWAWTPRDRYEELAELEMPRDVTRDT